MEWCCTHLLQHRPVALGVNAEAVERMVYYYYINLGLNTESDEQTDLLVVENFHHNCRRAAGLVHVSCK